MTTSNGNESGHLNDTIVVAPAAQAAAEIDLVKSNSFNTCAEDTAQRFLTAVEQPVAIKSISAVAVPVTLAAPAAMWRVAIDRSQAGTSAVFYMDIVYIAHGPYLEKIRVSRCSCAVAAAAGTGVDPGEMAALAAVSERVARSSG